MKFVILTIAAWFFGLLSYKAHAQEGDKKVTEQVNIYKSGEKDIKLTIEFTGDKITINGKPIMEFQEDGIVLDNKKIIMSDGAGFNSNTFQKFYRVDKARTFLGVVTEKEEEGVRIIEITKESPAEKAGLQKDDIIYKLGDIKISTSQELYDAVVKMKAGDEVKVYFKRGKKDKNVKAVLAEKKSESNMTFSFSGPDGSKTITIPPIPPVPPVPGAPEAPMAPFAPGDFDELRESFSSSFPRQQKLGLKIQDVEEGSGVKVVNVNENSAAEKAGLKKDDVITEIAGKKINNTDEAREWLQENNGSSSYTIKARRNGRDMSFEIKIPKKLKTTNL